MKLIYQLIIILTFISACSDQVKNTPPTVTTSQVTASADKIYTDYFEEFKAVNPIFATFVSDNQYNDKFSDPISAQSLAKKVAFEQKYLDQINTIDANLLSGQALLSLEIFKRDREISLQGFRFPEHLIPINQMAGEHNFFAQLGSGQSAQPFNTIQDYDNFIKRSEGFVKWMDSAITAMREGMRRV